MSLGVVKGMLLRHLRWWSKHYDIFNVDGTLNIGYAYPNMYMCEDYNSPQSPYWCMKTLIAISLSEEHEFWTCEELPHPGKGSDVATLAEPKQILISSPNHHYSLSLGQFCPWPIKASEAKYCKYAYSSAFAFSVPTGPLIQQLAPDNTLSIREGDTWRTMWKTSNPTIREVQFRSGGSSKPIAAISATWKPGKSPLSIETTVIAPTERWPDWHIRVHRIYGNSEFDTVEGGFAVPCRCEDGTALPVNDFTQENGVFNDDISSLILSPAGASGIVQLRPGEGKGEALKPDSNTNLMFQRSIIPTVKQSYFPMGEIRSVVAVFAVSRKHASLSAREIWDLWNDRPVVEEVSRGGADEIIIP